MRIALLGDVALFGRNTVRNDDFERRMQVAKDCLSRCDYVICNLESPLTNATRVVGGKSAYIKGSPEEVEILRWLGITHCSLANNHTFDYREEGLLDTIRVLESKGIRWYGVNGRREMIDHSDGKISLRGYCCYSTNAKGLERRVPYVNVLDPSVIAADLDSDKAIEAISILSCHWGQEHVHYPNYDHVTLARKLVSGRNAIVHGHHPHVLQGIETCGSALIAYSLGNFCFDDVYTNKSNKPLLKLSRANQETCILILHIEKGVCKEHEIVPLSFANEEYQFDAKILHKLREWSEFLRNPREEYNAVRSRELSNYLASRKKLRDARWYLKRLNLESVRMIIASKKNARRYSRLIGGYIN